MVAAYHLDEASGDATDSAGSNTLTDNATVGAASGKLSGARDFEAGNSEYFNRADNAALSFGDEALTIALWAQLESTGGVRMLLNKGATGAAEYGIYYGTGVNRFRWFVRGGTTTTDLAANTFGAVSTGVWYPIIVWHDPTANEIGIDVNGSADTTAHSAGINDGSGDFRLGAETGPASFWDGLLDEVVIWRGVVLTSGERSEYRNGGTGIAYPFTSQDTPELRGRPKGLRGHRQMAQLLAM